MRINLLVNDAAFLRSLLVNLAQVNYFDIQFLCQTEQRVLRIPGAGNLASHRGAPILAALLCGILRIDSGGPWNVKDQGPDLTLRCNSLEFDEDTPQLLPLGFFQSLFEVGAAAF